MSIDDFGTGYSSLYYLKRLPIDEIKIDRNYVSNIIHDKDDAAIVKTIVDIARHFGLKPVAEGVENKKQESFLHNIGCDTYKAFTDKQCSQCSILARVLLAFDCF